MSRRDRLTSKEDEYFEQLDWLRRWFRKTANYLNRRPFAEYKQVTKERYIPLIREEKAYLAVRAAQKAAKAARAAIHRVPSRDHLNHLIGHGPILLPEDFPALDPEMMALDGVVRQESGYYYRPHHISMGDGGWRAQVDIGSICQ